MLITYADQRNPVRRYTLYQSLNCEHPLTSGNEVDVKVASNAASGCCDRTTAILIILCGLDRLGGLALLILAMTMTTRCRLRYSPGRVYYYNYYNPIFISAAGRRPMSDNTCARSGTLGKLDLGHMHRAEKICKGEDR